MPPFQRVAIVLSPAEAGAALIPYAELLALRLGPESIRVIVPDPPEGASAGAAAVERILGTLPPTLAAARETGLLSSTHVGGEVLDAVLRETVAMPADVLLVGSRQGDRRTLARRLAMKAPCSVWMVPAGTPPALDRILVPIDFSARSADALGVAAALAVRTGAACDVLHVRFDATLAAPEAAMDRVIGREREAFDVFTARVDLRGVDVEGLFEEGGDVTRVILRVAGERRADLLVMGTRGRTRAAALLIGSETEHTLQESERPVLAVKHFGANLRLVEALLDPRFRRREGPRFG